MKKTLHTESLAIEIHGERFELYPEKALFWPARSTLIISDLHLGKSGHFRKNGIPVPAGSDAADLKRLEGLLERTSARSVLMLGDIFHSTYNAEWELFVEFIRQSSVMFRLVPGNHDILDITDYSRADIQMLDAVHMEGPFVFSHVKIDDLPGELYCLAGHEHPAIRLVGRGRQRVTLPCFYFGERFGLLPAFGGFTGLSRIHPVDGDRVYAIADQRVVDVSGRM